MLRLSALVDDACAVLLCVYICAVCLDGWAITSAGFPVAPSNVVLPALVAALFIGRKFKLPNSKSTALFLLALALVLLSVYWADDAAEAVFRLALMALYCFVAWVLATAGQVVRIGAVLIFSAVIVAVFMHALFWTGAGVPAASRFTVSESYNPTWVAASLTALAIATLSQVRRQKAMGGVVAAIACVALLFIVIATQGRTSLLALILSGLVAWIAHAYRRGGMRGLVRILGASSIGMICALMIYAYRYEIADQFLSVETVRLDRVALMLTGTSSEATAGRTEIWKEYLIYLIENPLKVAGPNGAPVASGIYRPTENAFLTIAVDFGIPLLVIWVWAHVKLIRRAYMSGDPVVIAAACFPMLLWFGNDVIYYKYYWFSVGLAACLVLHSERRNQQSGARVQLC